MGRQLKMMEQDFKPKESSQQEFIVKLWIKQQAFVLKMCLKNLKFFFFFLFHEQGGGKLYAA